VKNLEFKGVRVGQAVTFVDSLSRRNDALVTAVHGWNSADEWVENLLEQARKAQDSGVSWATDEYIANLQTDAFKAQWRIPSINAVYVSTDESKTDPYGRQLETRPTSVPHQSNQTAHGYYWVNL